MTIKPILHLKMEGDANDSSSNGHHGTVTGAVLTEDRFGRPNSSYELDGIDDKIVCPNVYNTAELTIALMIQIDTDDGWIINKRDDVLDDQWQIIHYGGALKFTVLDGHLETSVQVAGPNIVGTGWKCVIATTGGVNGSGIELYIDGEMVDSDTLTFDMKLGSREVVIGETGWTSSGHKLDGAVDDIRIYNHHMTPTQAKKIAADMMRRYGR